MSREQRSAGPLTQPHSRISRWQYFWKNSQCCNPGVFPFILLSCAFLFNAPAPAGAQQRPNSPTAPAPGVPGNFADITRRSGINFQYQASQTSKKYLMETMGAGVALFDYDGIMFGLR